MFCWRPNWCWKLVLAEHEPVHQIGSFQRTKLFAPTFLMQCWLSKIFGLSQETVDRKLSQLSLSANWFTDVKKKFLWKLIQVFVLNNLPHKHIILENTTSLRVHNRQIFIFQTLILNIKKANQNNNWKIKTNKNNRKTDISNFPWPASVTILWSCALVQHKKI